MQRIIQSWKSNPLYIRVIRLWLGVTWVYGGWNKATDKGFLDKASPHYTGEQLNGYLSTSPISSILRHMMEHAYQIGWLVMLSEFAIGFAILFGVAFELAAFGGFAMAITLWLSATWSVKPYFLGSDTAYAIMWLAYFLVLYNGNRRVDLNMDRRGILRLGSVFGMAAGFIGLGKLFPRSSAAEFKASSANSKIVRLERVPVGSTYKFTYSGQPAMLFRTKSGVFAYSLICTHQGCTVGYEPSVKQLRCPCHGAAYDPFKSAKVLAGPAPRALTSIKVKISGKNVVQA